MQLYNPNADSTDDRTLVRCRHSHLKLYRESPERFYAYHIAKTIPARETTDSMRRGTAVDILLLTPEDAEARIKVIDAAMSKSTSKVNMAAKAEIRKSAAESGAVVLNQKEYDQARAMADGARANRYFRSVLDSHPQVQKRFAWDCPWGGGQLPKRATLDIYQPGVQIVDLKTMADWYVHERRISSQVIDMGYHDQLAMYQEGVQGVTGGELLPVRLAVLSDEPPYKLVMLDIEGDELELGWRDNERACNELLDSWAYDDWKDRWTGGRVQFRSHV